MRNSVGLLSGAAIMCTESRVVIARMDNESMDNGSMCAKDCPDCGARANEMALRKNIAELWFVNGV